MSDFKIKYGPWALVAGASEGLGEAFARALAKRGMNIILIARRQEKLKNLSEELKNEFGIQIKYEALDLGDISAIREYITQLEEKVGLLIYNAAYAPILPFDQVGETQLETVVNVNIRAALLLSKMLSGQMLRRKKGGILLMSSLAGIQGSPGISAYSASKSFNMILAEGLWGEFKTKGIDVMSTCAGAIRTPGYKKAKGNREAPGTLDAMTVAERSLKALGKGPVYVPGFTNKIARLLLGRLLPRKSAISIMKKQTENLS